MKKLYFILLSLLLLSCPFVISCSTPPDGTEYLSELRYDLFEGESDSYSIKAYYGFIENPPTDDGIVTNTINLLKFKLIDKIENDITYTLHFKFEDKDFYDTFAVNPVKNSLTAEIEVDNFSLKEFEVEIKVGGNLEKITLRSILPEKTLNYKDALLSLKEKEVTLWDSFYNNNGEFMAEIRMRVIVKEGMPYWYVAFVSQDKNTKAFLLNGFSGEVLAVKDLF